MVTIQTLELEFDDLIKSELEMLRTKGEDYSVNKDRLSNFYEVAAFSGISPQMVVFSRIATKMVRMKALLVNNKNPNHESLADSIKDCRNYLFFLHLLLKYDKPQEIDENFNQAWRSIVLKENG